MKKPYIIIPIAIVAAAAIICAVLYFTGKLPFGKDTRPTYRIDFGDSGFAFVGQQESYHMGDPVEFRFVMIATDTNYEFTVDGEEFFPDYENNAYVFRFAMPDHDVVVAYDSYNSMVYVPDDYIEGEHEGYPVQVFEDQYGAASASYDSEYFYYGACGLILDDIRTAIGMVGHSLDELGLTINEDFVVDGEVLLAGFFGEDAYDGGAAYDESAVGADGNPGVIASVRWYGETAAFDAFYQALVDQVGEPASTETEETNAGTETRRAFQVDGRTVTITTIGDEYYYVIDIE